MVLAVFGGALVGVGVGISMKFGTSTGGFDIISQYLSLRRGRSVGQISTIFNFVLMLVGAIMLGYFEGKAVGNYGEGANFARWSVFILNSRLFATMILTDRIHTSYNYIEFNIITDYAEEISQGIVRELNRDQQYLMLEADMHLMKKHGLFNSYEFWASKATPSS